MNMKRKVRPIHFCDEICNDVVINAEELYFSSFIFTDMQEQIVSYGDILTLDITLNNPLLF